MASDRPVRVFISYSHDSADHAETVLGLADKLRQDGVEAWIDQYEPAPAQGWPRWMEVQVERANFVLCVCTETYLRRFDQREEAGRGLGVNWEGGLLRTRLYLDQGENKKIFPLLFAPEDREHVPLPLQAAPRFKPLTAKGYETLYRLLTDQPPTAPRPLGTRKVLPRLPRQSLFGDSLASTDDDADPAPDSGSPLAPLRGLGAGPLRPPGPDRHRCRRCTGTTRRGLCSPARGAPRHHGCRGHGLPQHPARAGDLR
jgi:hypothetical protein